MPTGAVEIPQEALRGKPGVKAGAVRMLGDPVRIGDCIGDVVPRVLAQARPPGIKRSAAQGLSASSLGSGSAACNRGLAAGENPSSCAARNIFFAVLSRISL